VFRKSRIHRKSAIGGLCEHG